MSTLRTAIAQREFLVTAEISPPKGTDLRRALELAQTLKPWVHAVNLTDCSRAVLAMGSVATAVALQQQTGIETICQMSGRDRNSLALQGDLLGGAALGLHNVLAITGDPVKAGDHPEARPVFECESVRILRLIAQLNEGYSRNGQPLPDGGTQFLAGAAVDPQSPSWSGLSRRFEQKVAAGAAFFQSQLICDFERLAVFMEKLGRPAGKPILAGIFLLKSAKNARFLNKYVPGVAIPEALIARLERAPNPLAEGIAIAAEQVQRARQVCDGVHLMAIKAEARIPEILQRAGLTANATGQNGASLGTPALWP
ncbi:MAG: methylenetetrahydrofolate reductase [Oscillatoriales cyanobacterium SM2_1_8]|nr:methylenetetrahydrofolate reductase [Oscillatoriales cyanobacterium SM2_1_8]